MDGLRKIVLEPRPKGFNYEPRKEVQAEAYFGALRAQRWRWALAP